MKKNQSSFSKYWLLFFICFILLSFVLTLAGIYGTFFVTPVIRNIPGLAKIGYSQKIFYFHVAVAATSVIAFAICFIASILYLVKQKRKYDILAYTSVEVGLLFALGLMAMGMSWDKAAWGRWWIWDPRLTTYLVVILVYAAYSVLRRSIEEEKRSTFAAVFGVIAFVTIPLMLLSTRIVPRSIHPRIVGISGMSTSMIFTLVIAMAAMFCLLTSLLLMRICMEGLKEEVESLKDKIEGN